MDGTAEHFHGQLLKNRKRYATGSEQCLPLGELLELLISSTEICTLTWTLCSSSVVQCSILGLNFNDQTILDFVRECQSFEPVATLQVGRALSPCGGSLHHVLPRWHPSPVYNARLLKYVQIQIQRPSTRALFVKRSREPCTLLQRCGCLLRPRPNRSCLKFYV